VLQQSGYRHIWVFDSEYRCPDGEVPIPVVLCARCLITGRRITIWADSAPKSCPFDTGPKSLFAVFSGTGDFQVWRTFGWPDPARVIDLYSENRMGLYGRRPGAAFAPGLLGAAAAHGVPAFESSHKDAMRDMLIAGTWTDADRPAIEQYCWADVEVTAGLLRALWPAMTTSTASWSGALMRGRYTLALASMTTTGVPIDVQSLDRIRRNIGKTKRQIIEEVDRAYCVFIAGSFSSARFEAYLAREKISWPRLPSGALALDDDTFRAMATAHPKVQALRELRTVLASTKLFDFKVGSDGRNRVFLNPFGSKTGRNQPGNAAFIFGSARWTRSLIKPPPGMAVLYCDFKSQEVAISATLSGDAVMWRDYASGDPYLAFGKSIGMIPPDGTKASHGPERDICKAIVLGVSYGMEAHSLAARANIHPAYAVSLLKRHREVYRKFWRFVQSAQDAGALGLPLTAQCGWTLRLQQGAPVNPRSLQNFLSQGNGSEMMRLAACMLTEAGIEVCAPVHDAFLVQCPADRAAQTAADVIRIMGDASEIILGKGRRCGVEAEKIVTYPDRYRDGKAADFYDTVMGQIAQAEALEAGAPADACPTDPEAISVTPDSPPSETPRNKR
jgi:hypothetical protein